MDQLRYVTREDHFQNIVSKKIYYDVVILHNCLPIFYLFNYRKKGTINVRLEYILRRYFLFTS